ncbi:RBCK1.2 family protein [Megaselia abdita]
MSRQQQVKTQNVAKSKSSSGLPTFLKWFKKSKETVNPSGALSSASQLSSSQDSLDDIIITNNLTTSSESLVSTATNGFAFIQPKKYEHTNGIGIRNPNLDHTQEETNSLLRRIRLQNTRRDHPLNCRISLKEKYCLQETDTLPSNKHRHSERIECTYENLDQNIKDNRRHTADNKNILRSRRTNFRRTVSDSSKDKSSGAYSHVKGKRRAPAPPTIEMPVQINENGEPITSVSVESTLNRKKRRAPPPPNVMQTNSEELNVNVVFPTSDVAKCSPRPWYKRSVAINRNSDIPFKREINLKTMEKRKKKDFNKKERDSLPDCANSRISIFDANNKLSILLRNKSEDKDKRKSGIAMPNISELDKETENFLNTRDSVQLTNDIILQQKMFEQATSNSCEPPKLEEGFFKPDGKIKSDDLDLVNVTWVCPYCTLENPSWRIICEACEKLKPYEKLKSPSTTVQMKSEIIKNYFENKLIDSPKDVKLMPKQDNPKKIEVKEPLIESSEVKISNKTPVYFAENVPSKPNDSQEIDVVRNARLQKFQNKPDENEANSLEEERKRLQEKIKALNSKALNEKYPIIQKTLSLEDNNSSANEETVIVKNTGAVPKKLSNASPKESNKSVTKRNKGSSKVSSSAQTSGILKKSLLSVNDSNSSEGLDSSTSFSTSSSPLRDTKDDVTGISERLNSVQVGIKDFQQNFKEAKSNVNISKTDTITLSKIIKNLENAISEGHYDLAAKLAGDLAKMKVNLQVTKLKKSETPLKDDSLPRKQNVLQSKRDVLSPSQDLDCLETKDIEEDILVRIFVEGYPFVKTDASELFIRPSMTIADLKVLVSKELSIPTFNQKWLINDMTPDSDSNLLKNLGVDMEKNNVFFLSKQTYLQNHTVNPNHSQGVVLRRPTNIQRNDLNITSINRKSSELFNIVEMKAVQLPRIIKETKKPMPINLIQKGKYRGVDNYNPNVASCSEASTPYVKTHYLDLLKLDSKETVPNIDKFECPICFLEVNSGEGVILRDCLHAFCKECLVNTVKYCDESIIKCPFMNHDYSCESSLQEREIKFLVTPELYEKHLAKSLREAQHNMENTFHCKTPNCKGWCVYEDNVNEFKCPICKIMNCLMCRVIHDGLTCKQYQDRLTNDSENNSDAKATKEMLQKMVEKGEAINCPTCQVIMLKKWGCDWLKCSMCKTEICWVTRGPRWGPAGKGDVSGGCKCGVNGIKCHPKCNYCH